MTQTSAARRLLLPFVPLYRLAIGYRELRLRRGWEQVRRLRYPVISVGNLSTGGSGKTPLTIALARLFTISGFRVDVLSRGYGRKNDQPARVRLDGTTEEFGDEPILIAREAGVPVYVAAQRYDAGLLAEQLPDASEESGHDSSRAERRVQNEGALVPEQARLHILDDGFQHRQLARDIDILLVDRHDWDDHLLPAGNLREALHAARRASVLAIPADDPAFESELRDWGWTGPIWRLHRRMEIPVVDGPVGAFCGIAKPGQFFDGLRTGGLTLVSQNVFPDHHCYTRRDLQALHKSARAAGATTLITTEKDHVRLGDIAAALPESIPVITVPLRVEIEDEAGALEWLTARLAAGVVNASL